METKQDLPPPGGFKRVQFERVPLKKYWPSPVKYALLSVIMGYGWYNYYHDYKAVVKHKQEKNDAELALYPLLLAESDRRKLRLCRQTREEETKLMKDVEGWVVGTLFGEPIYKTLKPNEWYDPILAEFCVHNEEGEDVEGKHTLRNF